MITPAAGRPDARRREPLWDRVDRNRLKLAGYVLLFVGACVVAFDFLFTLLAGSLLAVFFLRAHIYESAATALVAEPAAVMSYVSAGFALLALAWALFTLARSEKWLLRRLGATFVPTGEHLDTKMALKDMSLAAGLPVAPALYVLDTTNVNAFVFSARKRRAVLGVTQGMLDKLSIDEQRAVFANMVARLVSGDTIVATGVTALLWPLNAWRASRNTARNQEMDQALLGEESRSQPEIVILLVVFGIAFAIVGEIFAFGHRRAQLRTAEKADAEGMLLLKHPAPMLDALEKCVRLDNVVPAAGEIFGDLFYCWTGDSTNDEDDPEWHRVARLREVLGVEGWLPQQAG